MELKETILKRKSTRSYTGEQISDDELNEILKSANSAPIGMGRYDEVHLTVVQSKEMLDKIDMGAAKMIGDDSRHMLYGAPTLIIISHKIDDPNSSNIAYSDIACVFENMTLTATNLGLGSCAIWGAMNSVRANPELIKELGIPEEFTPCGGIVVGKTSDSFEERTETTEKISLNILK